MYYNRIMVLVRAFILIKSYMKFENILQKYVSRVGTRDIFPTLLFSLFFLQKVYHIYDLVI